MSKRKNVLNTADRTIIISRGLSTDHKTPKALRRYFSLKSLETSDDTINQLRCKADFWFDATQTPPTSTLAAKGAQRQHMVVKTVLF